MKYDIIIFEKHKIPFFRRFFHTCFRCGRIMPHYDILTSTKNGPEPRAICKRCFNNHVIKIEKKYTGW